MCDGAKRIPDRFGERLALRFRLLDDRVKVFSSFATVKCLLDLNRFVRLFLSDGVENSVESVAKRILYIISRQVDSVRKLFGGVLPNMFAPVDSVASFLRSGDFEDESVEILMEGNERGSRTDRVVVCQITPSAKRIPITCERELVVIDSGKMMTIRYLGHVPG